MFVAWDAIRKPLWSTKTKPDPTEYDCLKLTFPSYLADVVFGAISLLTRERMWVKDGDDTVDDTVAMMGEIMLSSFGGCGMIGEVVSGAWDEIPENTLLCDGTRYWKDDYPALYAVLAPVYIVDGDRFETPNLTSRFVRGEGDGDVIGDNGGESTVSLTAEQNGPHTHTSALPFAIPIPVEPGPIITVRGIPLQYHPTSSSGGGFSHENKPPYEVLKYVIVAG